MHSEAIKAQLNFSFIMDGKWTDGTYEQFADYVEKPVQYGSTTFDLIIVDGRARVAAAESVIRY